MDELNSAPLATGQVLERLRGLGLCITRTQLDNDTRDGFLPERVPEAVVEGRGRSGRWEPWMVQRAERLYRLRKIKETNGRPALSGDVLRIVLFLADGWGWSRSVRDSALQGYDKTVAATLAPMKTYTKRHRENEQISFALETHDVELSPGEKYAIGTLVNGEPLDGVSTRPLYDFAKDAGLLHGLPLFADSIAQQFGMASGEGEFLITEMFRTLIVGAAMRPDDNAGFDPTFRSLIAGLSDEDAEASLRVFRQFVRDLRAHIHRSAAAEHRPGFSTSPITMFGRRQRDLEREFREGGAPRRITPAQSLALFASIALVGGWMIEKFFGNLEAYAGIVTSVLRAVFTPGTNEK